MVYKESPYVHVRHFVNFGTRTNVFVNEFLDFLCDFRVQNQVLAGSNYETMNHPPKRVNSKPASQQDFLRVFLASEREILKYVIALVGHLADAQEIVQQTAVVLWEKFDEYDHSRPFAPWACRFALNVSRQWMDRRRRWKALLDNGLAEELAKRRQQLQDEFDARLSHLGECLDKLPDEQRGLVEGYYFQQTGVETLATQVQRSVEAVYKSLQRIRYQLRECIEKTQREEATT